MTIPRAVTWLRTNHNCFNHQVQRDWPLFGEAFIQYLDHKPSTGFFSHETSKPFWNSARREWNRVVKELLILRN